MAEPFCGWLPPYCKHFLKAFGMFTRGLRHGRSPKNAACRSFDARNTSEATWKARCNIRLKSGKSKGIQRKQVNQANELQNQSIFLITARVFQREKTKKTPRLQQKIPVLVTQQDHTQIFRKARDIFAGDPGVCGDGTFALLVGERNSTWKRLGEENFLIL